MCHRIAIVMCSAALAAGLGALVSRPADQPPAGDYEKQVKEPEVPKAALDTLKRLAAGAAFTEFAEEVEKGRKFYEGSWKGPNGQVDALVTASGDLVEIEESIPADMVPGPARAEAAKEAGKEAMTFEKKTVIMYEVHFKKEGKTREIILLPDGKVYHEEGAGEKDGDEDEKK